MITEGWFTESIGSVAAVCTTIAFLPQLVRVWRRKSADDISLSMFLIFSTGVALWLVYGLRINSPPMIAANTVTLILAIGILVLKLRYDARARTAPAGGQPRVSGKIEA
jgi:MtN3 and saliva related transmembrane protein